MQKGQPEKMLNHSVSAIESVYITSLRYVCSVCISAVTKTSFFLMVRLTKWKSFHPTAELQVPVIFVPNHRKRSVIFLFFFPFSC